MVSSTCRQAYQHSEILCYASQLKCESVLVVIYQAKQLVGSTVLHTPVFLMNTPTGITTIIIGALHVTLSAFSPRKSTYLLVNCALIHTCCIIFYPLLPNTVNAVANFVNQSVSTHALYIQSCIEVLLITLLLCMFQSLVNQDYSSELRATRKVKDCGIFITLNALHKSKDPSQLINTLSSTAIGR